MSVQPFDHSRFDWYPAGLGGPGQVQRSDGSPRPALRTPLNIFGVHYGGAGTSWLDFGDTANELRGIELNHARPSGKPNEYNSANDSASETWGYAGPFEAAHSSGNNATVWGHLVIYGLETLTEDQAQALIRGVRRARAQCVTAGYITPGHQVLPHQLLPGARTSCPGPLWTNRRWWAQIVAPLTSADFDQPTPHPAPLIPEENPIDPEEDEMQTAIAAIYQPIPALISQGMNKSFALLPGGDVRHAAGPDAGYATAVKLPVILIGGVEHYNQCVELDAVWRSKQA